MSPETEKIREYEDEGDEIDEGERSKRQRGAPFEVSSETSSAVQAALGFQAAAEGHPEPSAPAAPTWNPPNVSAPINLHPSSNQGPRLYIPLNVSKMKLPRLPRIKVLGSARRL